MEYIEDWKGVVPINNSASLVISHVKKEKLVMRKFRLHSKRNRNKNKETILELLKEIGERGEKCDSFFGGGTNLAKHNLASNISDNISGNFSRNNLFK